MGTLLLGRQVIGAIALALGDAAYRSQLQTAGPASATGSAVAWVAGTGTIVATLALLGLRDRFPDVTPPAAPAEERPLQRAPLPVG